MPLAVVQVDAHPERGVREPDVVAHDMERVAPPRVPLHPRVVQDLLQVQADLDAELALLFDRRGDPVALGPVGDREEQPPQRPEVDTEPPAQPGELQIGRVDDRCPSPPGKPIDSSPAAPFFSALA